MLVILFTIKHGATETKQSGQPVEDLVLELGSLAIPSNEHIFSIKNCIKASNVFGGHDTKLKQERS